MSKAFWIRLAAVMGQVAAKMFIKNKRSQEIEEAFEPVVAEVVNEVADQVEKKEQEQAAK